MNVKKIATLGLGAMLTVPALAEVKHQKYIKADLGWMHNYYYSWQPGQAPTGGAEDENFFIGRVKPRKRFTFEKTQVIQDRETTRRSKRKMLFWCPIGENGWTSLPRYAFDSEAFSSWSYVDIFGNWTQGFLRQPGAFADVCHKNGVASAVCSTAPWAEAVSTNDGGHGQNYSSLIGGADKLMQLLKYYGIDGLGFNSEQSWLGGLRDEMRTLFENAQSLKMKYDLPLLHFDMYQLSDVLNSSGVGTDWSDFFPAANGFFLNYNWGAQKLQTSVSNATSKGGNSFDVYAGMDQQGRSWAEWTTLSNADISVGIWGAHNKNMIYESSVDNGSTADAIQARYLVKSEQFFTGGTRNPVNNLQITNILTNGSSTTFHGVAKLVAAKSALSWSAETNGYFPFKTYLNLGNGKFFNNEGKTTYNDEWYNIGMQDYLPTWRWWLSKTFMGRNASSDIPNGISAGFTYEDAWFGGSCLKVSASATATDKNFYLQLFKTQFPIEAAGKMELVIRYKVLKGSGNLSWAVTDEDETGTEVQNGTIGAFAQGSEWVEVKKTIGGKGGVLASLATKTMALLGLKFENVAPGTEILIGEISLMKKDDNFNPVKPTIDTAKTKLLRSSYRGIDFKMSWNVTPLRREKNEIWMPVYNEDCDTWYYEIWFEQKGQPQQLVTATTSWAAYAVDVPLVNDGEQQVRFGVRAVAYNGATSQTEWTNYFDCSRKEIIEGFSIDKPVIKANQQFTVKFDDPNHSAGTFEIFNSKDNQAVANGKFENVKEFTTSLANVGLYDVKITYHNGTQYVTETNRGMIQVSGDEVGKMPQILTLTPDNAQVKAGEAITISYTANSADGTTSRGLRLDEIPFCVKVQDIYDAYLKKNKLDMLNFNTSGLTISYWFSPIDFIPAGDDAGNTGFGDCGTQMLNIRNPNEGYPGSEWGFVWSGIHNGGNDYWINIRKAAGSQQAGVNYTTMTDGFVIPKGKWTHMALTIDAAKNAQLFINGRLVSDKVQNKSNAGTLDNGMFIFMGGPAKFRSGFLGSIDEFQIWKKAMTDKEIEKAMRHYEADEVPEDLVAYWDFEQEVDTNFHFANQGSVGADLKAYVVTSWNNEKQVGNGEKNPDQKGNRLAPAWVAGTPFLGGKFKVETTPTWSFTGNAENSPFATSNDAQGGTSIKWASMADAPYTVTLTLENSWGKDTKTITVLDAPTSLDALGEVKEDLTIFPNPFVEEIHVRLVEAGVYEMEVFDLSGKKIQTQEFSSQAGDIMRVAVSGEKGMYLVRLKNGGKFIKSFKIEKK